MESSAPWKLGLDLRRPCSSTRPARESSPLTTSFSLSQGSTYTKMYNFRAPERYARGRRRACSVGPGFFPLRGVFAAFSRPLLVSSFSLCDLRLFVIERIVSLLQAFSAASRARTRSGFIPARPTRSETVSLLGLEPIFARTLLAFSLLACHPSTHFQLCSLSSNVSFSIHFSRFILAPLFIFFKPIVIRACW